MAYIIVSDVHLGAALCHYGEFCDFLKWVHGLENNAQQINCKGKDIIIHSPEKFLLLGDILELWDPKYGNRDYVTGDSLLPLTLLAEIKCDKIYVVGNHDDSLSGLENEIDYVILPNKTKLDIYDRHYPYFSFYWDEIPGKDDDQLIEFLIKNYDVNWIRSGRIEKSDGGRTINITDGKNVLSLTLNDGKKEGYLKINGNMADGIIKSKMIDNKLEASISKSLKIGERTYFFLHGHQYDKEQAILAWVSELIGGSWNPLGWFQDLFNISFTRNNWQRNFGIFLILIIGGQYFLWERFLQHSFWLTLLWGSVTGFFALSSIPGIVARSQSKIYSLTKPINKTAQQVVEDKYYLKHKDKIKTDAIVFGHTHFASSYVTTDTEKKLFINSGCWVGKDDVTGGKQRYTNTFVYIDEGGAYILTWRGAGKIECIEAYPVGQI